VCVATHGLEPWVESALPAAPEQPQGQMVDEIASPSAQANHPLLAAAVRMRQMPKQLHCSSTAAGYSLCSEGPGAQARPSERFVVLAPMPTRQAVKG
jgi:hypothetical protein